jgi:hypothetical protein
MIDPEAKAAVLEELAYQIQQEIEFLETTEGDTVECIGIENLEGILGKFFGVTKLNISIN